MFLDTAAFLLFAYKHNVQLKSRFPRINESSGDVQKGWVSYKTLKIKYFLVITRGGVWH